MYNLILAIIISHMLLFVFSIICTRNFYIRQYQTERYLIRTKPEPLTLSLGEFKESELYYVKNIASDMLKIIHSFVDPELVLNITDGKSILTLFANHGGPNQRFMLYLAEKTKNVYRLKYGTDCLEYFIDEGLIKPNQCVDSASEKHKYQLFEFVYEEDLHKKLLNESSKKVDYLQNIIKKQNKILEEVKAAKNIQTDIYEEINKFAPNNESI